MRSLCCLENWLGGICLDSVGLLSILTYGSQGVLDGLRTRDDLLVLEGIEMGLCVLEGVVLVLITPKFLILVL